MSGLQTIVNYASTLEINRRKVVGLQFTRNELPRVSQTPTYNPWKFTLTFPNSYRYNEARALMEALDTLDRTTPQVITFSNIPQLSWIFRYQGSMSTNNINNIRVQSFIGNQLTLINLPTISSTRVLFEPNDLIQIGNKTFPFTSTTRVTRGTGSSVVVTTSRPNIITGSVVNSSIRVGNSCQFFMFCPNMPVYKLIPGAPIYNSSRRIINNAIIEFSDAFQLYEWVASA